MNFLKKVDKYLNIFAEYFLAFIIFALTSLVFIQVISRYLFHTSFAGTEELPRFLMAWGVFFAAGLLAREDGHINITVINMIFKKEKAQKIIKAISHLISVILMIGFLTIAFDYVKFNFITGDTTASLGLPVWWITSCLVVCAVLMIVYYTANFVKSVKEMFKWK